MSTFPQVDNNPAQTFGIQTGASVTHTPPTPESISNSVSHTVTAGHYARVSIIASAKAYSNGSSTAPLALIDSNALNGIIVKATGTITIYADVTTSTTDASFNAYANINGVSYPLVQGFYRFSNSTATSAAATIGAHIEEYIALT